MGGGVLTALGDLQTTWDGLCAGRSGLHVQAPFAGLPAYPLGVIPGAPLNEGRATRLDGIIGALFQDIADIPENAALIVATTKGAVDELIDDGTCGNRQPWELGSVLQQHLGIHGPLATVSGACASGTLALIRAVNEIRSGRIDHALVVGLDLVARFILAGFDSLKALSPTGPRPFDQRRNGLALADGAAWMLLSADDAIDRQGVCELHSYGVSCDATHITAPCRYATGLKRVFEQLTAMESPAIGGINAHGTATVYNDAMELLAFKERCVVDLPVCSVKGALGHTLGAAGLIEAMLSVISLQRGVLPPTVGLDEPEPASVQLSGSCELPLLSPSVLSCNSGFGGINAAVLFTPFP